MQEGLWGEKKELRVPWDHPVGERREGGHILSCLDIYEQKGWFGNPK